MYIWNLYSIETGQKHATFEVYYIVISYKSIYHNKITHRQSIFRWKIRATSYWRIIFVVYTIVRIKFAITIGFKWDMGCVSTMIIPFAWVITLLVTINLIISKMEQEVSRIVTSTLSFSLRYLVLCLATYWHIVLYHYNNFR